MTSTASAVFTVAVLCVFGGLTRLVCQTYVFRQRLAGCRPIHDGPARTLLDQLLGQLPLRRDVTLLTSVTYPEPVAFGLLRWRIVLPAGIDRKLSGDELKALLAHELAHLVRGDAVWLWIGRVLCSCCAFQPLNFLARREWRRAVEYQCDDWAVRHAVGVLSLARCLTLVAEWRLRTAVHAEALAAAGPKSVLADRVERLIEQSDRTDPWTGRFYGGALRVLGLATVLALACWGPQAVLLAKPTVSILPSNILLKKPIPSRARQQAVWKMTGKLPLPDGRGSEKHLFQRSSELADELDSLNAEIDWLEREVSELYRMVNQSPSQPGIRRVAERMRLRMAEISRRRDFLVSVLPQPGFSHHLE